MRLAAAEALGHIGSVDDTETEIYLQPLQDTLVDTDWMVRSAAIDALSRINAGDEVTVRLLQEALTDTSEYVRRSAIMALGGLQQKMPNPDQVIVEAIRACLKDTNQRVRMAAAKTLHTLNLSNTVSRAVLRKCPADHSYIFNLTAKDIKSFAALRNAAIKDADREVRYFFISIISDIF